MIKFLHAADLHLDAPFSALSPEQAAARRQEQRALLTDLAEAANAQDCDVVLLAGDLFVLKFVTYDHQYSMHIHLN